MPHDRAMIELSRAAIELGWVPITVEATAQLITLVIRPNPRRDLTELGYELHPDGAYHYRGQG